MDSEGLDSVVNVVDCDFACILLMQLKCAITAART